MTCGTPARRVVFVAGATGLRVERRPATAAVGTDTGTSAGPPAGSVAAVSASAIAGAALPATTQRPPFATAVPMVNTPAARQADATRNPSRVRSRGDPIPMSFSLRVDALSLGR